MRIRLVAGDWSKDGHNQSDTYMYEVNLSSEELSEAFKLGAARLGQKFNDGNYRGDPAFNFCENYRDSKIPPQVVAAMRREGLDPDDFFQRWTDKTDGDADYVAEIDLWPEFWLAVAKLGNPSLTYKKTSDEGWIAIGGYGLYND